MASLRFKSKKIHSEFIVSSFSDLVAKNEVECYFFVETEVRRVHFWYFIDLNETHLGEMCLMKPVHGVPIHNWITVNVRFFTSLVLWLYEYLSKDPFNSRRLKKYSLSIPRFVFETCLKWTIGCKFALYYYFTSLIINYPIRCVLSFCFDLCLLKINKYILQWCRLCDCWARRSAMVLRMFYSRHLTLALQFLTLSHQILSSDIQSTFHFTSGFE